MDVIFVEEAVQMDSEVAIEEAEVVVRPVHEDLTLRVLEEEGLVERVATRSKTLIESLQALEGVQEVRGLGYLLGIQCELGAKELQTRLMDERILIGTSGDPNTVRLLPPLTVSDAEWDRFLDVFGKALKA